MNALPREFAEALALVRASGTVGSLGARVHYLPSTGSTNDVAAGLAADRDAEGTVVVADAQTAGRGRLGRTWFSPPGSGLYVSVVLTPRRAAVEPERATRLLTLAAGVALAEAVEAASGLAPAIKWPNDLTVGRRKLAGILAEAIASPGSVSPPQAVVLGYGINVGAMAYPPDLADRATSLETELGRPVDRAALFGESLRALATRYGDLLGGRYDAILDEWRRRAPRSTGARVEWDTPAGVRTGTTAGIDEQGALLVRAANGIERLLAGEVRWI